MSSPSPSSQPVTSLSSGQRVRLEDETGVFYVSEVRSAADNAMSVKVLDPVPDEIFLQGATAYVGIAGPNGLRRLEAVVSERSPGDTPTIELQPAGQFELLQRREQPRVPVSFSLSCRRMRAEG